MTFMCTLVYIFIQTLANGFNIDNLPWSYDTVQLWANFHVANASLFTNYDAQFVGEHYNIISFAKCTGSPTKDGIPSEKVFEAIASKIRQYASTKKIKILFYFAADYAPCVCYNITQSFCANQSMYLRDDYGNIIYSNNDPQKPFYDHRQLDVRQVWVNAVTSVMNMCLANNIIVNGIFVDGADKQIAAQNANFSTQSQKQYDNAIFSLLDEARNTFSAINDDLMVIANGIHTSGQRADDWLSLMPHADGMLGDHYMAWEEVMQPNGNINVTYLLFWFNISKAINDGVYGANKTVIMKGWIGPETSPMNSFGPSWPVGYGQTPTTLDEVRNAALELITYPLATYLCGIYNQYFYFAYAWLWNMNQGWVPCPNDPSSCSAPTDWYKEFQNKLGKPLSDGIMTDKTKCNRTFENAKVYVDLNDNSSAIIEWL
eukprot:150354_1